MKTVYGLPKKREEVIEELQTAFANQNLDEAEYESRLNEALAANSIEDLEVLVLDFPPQIKSKLFPKEVETTVQVSKPTATAPLPMIPIKDTYRAIMSSDNRSIDQLDQQTVSFFALMSQQHIDLRQTQLQGNRFKLHIECLLGNTEIDLRNEDLAGRHIEIWVGGGLGEIKIKLPKGGIIQKEAQMFGGSLNIKDKRKSWINRLTGNVKEETATIQFTVSLHGTYWLGNVDIVY